MIKKIIVSLSLLLSLISFAQQSTSSPYSYYGIGDVRFKGTIENKSMGGISFVADSIHINLQNPALLSSLKLTTFTIGGTFSPERIKTNTETEKSQRTTLDYLSVAFPAKKLAIGFGLIPYASVGYQINNSSSGGTIGHRYNGTGGVNKVYSTFSYKINKNFNIGADISYNFGTIETSSISYPVSATYGTRELNTSIASGFSLNTGVSFQSKIDKKHTLYSGLTFSPSSNLTFSNSREINTITFNSLGAVSVVDSSNGIVVADTKIKMPTKISFGAGIGEFKKWLVGTELVSQDFNGYGNRFNDFNTNQYFEKATKISFGGYYIPKYNSFNNYLNRVTYRGGFRYENTGLVINSEKIKEQAFTFGFGLPLSGTFSNINIGVELGKRGTKKAGLVQEEFANFSIGLTFNDRWFVKSKYD